MGAHPLARRRKVSHQGEARASVPARDAGGAREDVAKAFGIAEAMAAEIMFENDEYSGYWQSETPEQRWSRMRQWIASLIVSRKDELDG